MNLLDKHYQKGLAFLPALFLLLFSCEEPSELGVKLNPKEGQISTHYIEIPIESSQLRIDTVVSSSTVSSTINPQTGRPSFSYSHVLIGKVPNDPAFGTITATAFTNIGTPIDTVPGITSGAGVDSIFLRLRLGTNYIGEDITSSQELNIFSLPSAIRPKPAGSATTKPQYKYFITDKEEVAEEIGQITFDTTDLKNSTLTIRLNSNSEFASKIMNQLKTDKSVFTNQQDFNNFIGGLALVPGENNSFITNYFIAGSSGIDFYYGGKKSPISFAFIPQLAENQAYVNGDYLPTYSNIETDFTGTIFENAPTGNNVEFQNPDNQIYFNAGVGLLPKFSFSGLEDFVISNSENSIIINKATLEVDSIYNSRSTKTFPFEPNFLYVDDENNKPVFRVSQPAGAPFRSGDTRYNSGQDTIYSYTADVAVGVEYFVKTQDSDYLQGIMYPSSTSTSLFNVIAEPKRIVLKIYYTMLKN